KPDGLAEIHPAMARVFVIAPVTDIVGALLDDRHHGLGIELRSDAVNQRRQGRDNRRGRHGAFAPASESSARRYSKRKRASCVRNSACWTRLQTIMTPAPIWRTRPQMRARRAWKWSGNWGASSRKQVSSRTAKVQARAAMTAG